MSSLRLSMASPLLGAKREAGVRGNRDVIGKQKIRRETRIMAESDSEDGLAAALVGVAMVRYAASMIASVATRVRMNRYCSIPARTSPRRLAFPIGCFK
jgi:hypothetical protein